MKKADAQKDPKEPSLAVIYEDIIYGNGTPNELKYTVTKFDASRVTKVTNARDQVIAEMQKHGLTAVFRSTQMGIYINFFIKIQQDITPEELRYWQQHFEELANDINTISGKEAGASVCMLSACSAAHAADKGDYKEKQSLEKVRQAAPIGGASASAALRSSALTHVGRLVVNGMGCGKSRA